MRTAAPRAPRAAHIWGAAAPRRMEPHRKVLGTLDPPQRLVALLAASDGGAPIRGRTRLQSMAFLLSEASDDMVERCGYGAGDRGPHSEIVGEAARRLGEMGVLRLDGGDGGISITPMGRRVAVGIAEGEDGDALDAIDACKDMLNDLPADEVFAYVCLSYPRMAKRSAVHDRVMQDMERHVMSMLKKEKISAERAAELLERPLDYILGRRAGRRFGRRGGRA